MSEEEQTQTASVANAAEPSTETSAAPPEGAPERVAALEQQVAELERQLATEREAATDYMNRWQRAQADFANYKRRAQQEQEQLQRTFAAEAARLALPALDSFERAFATLPATLRSFTWIDGMALVEMQLRGMLNAAGVQQISTAPGHAFDPMKHEAIGAVETAEHPEGHVAVVIQPGYEVAGMLLRPALVQVARAPASAAPESAADATATTSDTLETTTTGAETATQDAPAS